MAAQDETLTVAFRLPDGRVVAQDRHPGPTPHWFRDARLFAGDGAFVEAYLDLGRIAQRDAPVPVRPAGHGLVVFDLRGGAYLSMQDAHDYLALEASWFGGQPNPQYLALVRGLLSAGRLGHRVRRPGQPDELRPLASEAEVAEVGRRARATWSPSANGEVTEDFVIDPSPLAHRAFARDAEGAAAMRAELARLGIAPGDGWQEWVDGLACPAAAKRSAPARAAAKGGKARGAAA